MAAIERKTKRYPTDLTDEVWYYLRGEEYSAQIDYFAESITTGRVQGENTFRLALEADRIVSMIAGQSVGNASPPGASATRKGVFARMFK